MFLLTPEIAWHDTLPIYSCDLQPIPELRKWLYENINDTEKKERVPFGELPVNDQIISKTEPQCLKNNIVTEEMKNEKTIWSRLATCGGDHIIRLWRVELNYSPPSDQKDGSSSFLKGFTFISSLKKHDKPVNVVRWSNSGRYLASGSDDSTILIWANKSCDEELIPKKDSEEEELKEIWIPIKVLRRHLEDIFDLCWSSDDKTLISGSVDCSVIIWNQLDLEANENCGLQTHKTAIVMRDAKHYVQGVTWDPFCNYFATMSCDRVLRLYSITQKTCTNQISKTSNKLALFQDDSWKSFFRRLSFSPDGLLLFAPSGYIETAEYAADQDLDTTSTVEGEDKKVNRPQHAAHLFLRSKLTEPAVSFPTGVHPVVCVRFCNQPFVLRKSTDSEPAKKLIDLPYRWVFCLVLEDGLILGDTQSTVPFAFISSIHYQALNDASWSDNGRLLVTCSTDGYCSLIYFGQEELGIPYTHGQIGVSIMKLVPRPVGDNGDMCDESAINDSCVEGSELLESDVTTAAYAADCSNVDISLNMSKDVSFTQPVPDRKEVSVEISNIQVKKRRVSLLTLPTD